MKSILGFLCVFTLSMAIAVPCFTQPGNRSGQRMQSKGSSRGEPKCGPPEMGHVIPPFVREELSLSKDQQKQIADLEADTKAKLQKILSKRQQQQFEEILQRGPPGMGPGGGPPDQNDNDRKGGGRNRKSRADTPAPGIAWFGTLERGLAEGKRTNRAILLVSAAPHCGGVSGIW